MASGLYLCRCGNGFWRGEIKNIENAFFKVIDEHTPFYQEIFQMLTGQQRRIFDILISFGETATPKHISEKARIKLQTVNTQLRRLETDGYVISRPMGRHTKYEVREQLFRLWREMRQPFGRKRVSILLDFLQLWYTAEERKELFKSKFEVLEAGEKSVLRELCYYAKIQPIEFKTEALLKLTPKLIELGERDEVDYDIRKLKETAVKTNDKELECKIQFYEGQLLYSENKYEEALKAFNKVLEMNSIDEFTLYKKCLALGNLGKYKEALDVFNMVLEINPKYENALFFKGLALGNLGKYKEALDVFNMVLEFNPKYEDALFNKGFALENLGKYKEALDVFNMVLEINPKHENALRNKAVALFKSEMYNEGLDVAKKTLDVVTKEHSKIDASLIVIETYIVLNRKAEAAFEIDKIKNKITDQEPDLIEYFTEICLNLALEELKEGNRGNAAKFITMALENSSKLEMDIIKESTMNFLKAAVYSGELHVIKAAAEEILNLQKNEFTGLIRPITKAIEIIETRDLKKYYDLQIEEREIVADVVKKIINSDELVPDEIKRKDSY